KNNLDLDFEKLIEQFPLSKKKLDEITPDELSKTVKWYEDLVSKLQQAFENAARSSKDEDKEKIRELYIEFSQMGFKKWKEYITNKIRSGEISHKDFSDAVKE
ncbi:MAG: hypothetical protein N2254_05295, partial [bacterium]|nr:hypothetical protein [bacterium]